MANWHAMQKRKRELMDTPLQEDMVSSGGAHNQNKGYGESDGPPMMSKGPHTTGHGKDNSPNHHDTREPVKKTSVGGVKVKMQDNYGGGNSGNYDLLDAPKDAFNAIKSFLKPKDKKKVKTNTSGGY